MLIKNKINIDYQFGCKTFCSLKHTTRDTRKDLKLIKFRWISLLILLLNNSEPNILFPMRKIELILENAVVLNHQLLACLLKSTGQPRVELLQLKIKANAVPVGLSPQPDPWKVLISTLKDHWNHFPNSNLLIAQLPTETLDVMEDGWTHHSSTLLIMELLWNPNTLIKVSKDHANTKLPIKNGESLIALKSVLISNLVWKLQLLQTQFQLPSKPTISLSNYTNQEFIREIVELVWITECWQ